MGVGIKKNILLFISILIFIIFLSSTVTAIPNPSAVYCEEMGYSYKIEKTPEGEKGICVINGKEFKAWDFYRGKVGKEYSYCAKKGYDTKTEHIQKESYSVEYAVCVPKIPGEQQIPMHKLMEKNGEPLTVINQIKQNKFKEPVHPISKGIQSYEIESLPSSFDWRNISDHTYIGSIGTQGNCGACFAFGALASAESAYNIAYNLTDGNCIDFSEAFLAFCLSDIYSGFDGCDGSDYEYEELDAIVDEGMGVCNESAFPYTDHEQPCYAPAWNAPRIEFDAWSRIETLNIDSIKTAIMTYGLVDVGVDVGEPGSEFRNYNGGIFSDSLTTCPDGYYTSVNHAVALVGWGHDPTEGDYWILRNSWGTDWGENGYMRITPTSARVACMPAYIEFGRPKGRLQPYIIDIPSVVEKNKFFTIETGVRCVNGSCGNVSATLTLPPSQPITCSEIWGFDCGAAPPESGDNTFDSCSYGAGEDESIEEIYLDKSSVDFGEEIEVKCLYDTESGTAWAKDKLYIYYRNSPTGVWVKKAEYDVSSQYFLNKNYSAVFVPDSIEGEHQVRCLCGYDISGDECAEAGGAGSYYDNDDANFSVYDHTSGKGKIPMDYGSPFYTINQNPINCTNMTNQTTCNQTWTVNATGAINSSWLFYTIYDSDFPGIKTKETAKINITIIQQMYEQFNINLNEGWNLISIPLVLENNSVNNIFNNKPIFAYNNSWFIPENIDNKLGYWVKSNENINITISGTEIPNSIIELYTGSNLIGYPSLNEENINIIFEDINDSLINVLSYENNNYYSYSPLKQNNALEIMKPGLGYFVDVNESVTLEIS